MVSSESRSSTPLVSAIVPTFRRFRPVLDTVRALLDQHYTPLEIIVADQNGEWPADLVAERDALAADPRVDWLRIDPPGVVVARNRAVQRAAGEILLFVDDDVALPDADFITRHVRNYADPSIVAVAGCELRTGDPLGALPPLDEIGPSPEFAAGNPLEAVLTFNRSSHDRRTVCTFCTCNGSMRRDAFLAVGGFDENFAGNSYGDDYDLALRLADTNARIVYDPSARLIHLKAPIGGLRASDSGNPFGERDKVLSGALMFFRHGRAGFRWNLFYNYVLRRSILLRRNIERPWRQPAAWLGTIAALWDAARRVRRGPTSRLGAGR
jgi:GT2 family glycosyltransferase